MVERTEIAKNEVTAPMLGEKLSRFQKFRKGIKVYGYLSLAFLIPAVIMYLIYIAMKIHPFGEGSVLVLDLNGQYVSFYEGLRHAIYGDMSMIYSFARNLGGEFMGMYAYYLASPFSYIVALFPNDMILEALLTIFLLKTGLCGFTFGFYLHKTSAHKNNFNRVSVIAFSIMYALTAYCVVQQHNSMWIDAVIWLPIILYGIEELIKKGHYKLFTISLAISIMSNFYIGWMTCICCAVYFFVYYFMHNENNRNNPYREKRHFGKSFLRMVLFSAIAVAISAVIILTTYYALSFGKNDFSNTNWKLTLRFDILDIMAKFLPCSYDTVRPEGLPFVYCGVLTLLLIPLYFCSNRYSVREKVLSGSLIVFFLLSFLISPVDLVWHGFQKPNWLNYRYSFMLCFVLLTLAYRGFTEIKRTSYKPLLFMSGALILFAGIAQKLDLETFVLGDGSNDRHHEVGKLLTFETVWFTVVLVVIYVALLCIFRKTKRVQNLSLVLAIIVSMEMFANGLVNCLDLGSDVVYTSYTSYHNNIDPLKSVASIIKNNDSSFYRAEEVYHRKANDNMALNLYGLTGSTSTLNSATIRFLMNMGYLGKSHESRYYAGNPLADSLLGIKYVITGSGETSTEFRNDKILLKDTGYYSEFYANDDYSVYENLYSLSLAYAVNSQINDIEMSDYQNPYDRLNAIVSAMTGETVQVFVPLEDYTVSKTNLTESHRTPHKDSNFKYPFISYVKTNTESSASVKYMLSIPYIDTDEETQKKLAELAQREDEEVEDEEYEGLEAASQYLYFYMPSEFQRAITISINSSKYEELFGSGNIRGVYLGSLKEGSVATINLTLGGENLYVTDDVPLFYYIDLDAYSAVMEKLSKSQFIIDEDFTDDRLTGTLTTYEDNLTVFTSIPYDDGWKAIVDGKEVPIHGTLGDTAFTGKGATDEALIAFDIASAGNHTVELVYRPRALTLGVAITAFGIITLVLIMVIEFIVKRKRGKAPMLFAIPVTAPADEAQAPEDKVETPENKVEAPPEPPEPPEQQDSPPPQVPEDVGDGLEPAIPLRAMKLEEAILLEPASQQNNNPKSKQKTTE